MCGDSISYVTRQLPGLGERSAVPRLPRGEVVEALWGTLGLKWVHPVQSAVLLAARPQPHLARPGFSGELGRHAHSRRLRSIDE